MDWTPEWTPVTAVSTGREFGAWPVLFEADGKPVLLSFSDALGRVTRWDPETGRECWHVDFRAGGGPCAVARVGGGGRVLAVATERGVERLDALTGAELASPRMEVGTVWDVAAGVLPGGRAFVAGAGHCHQVFRWDAETGEPLGQPLAGHGTCVKSVAVVPGSGGPLIVSGDENGVVLLWCAVTGTRIAELTGPADSIVQLVPVSFPAGATLLACVDHDRLLWRWDAATREPVGAPVPLGGDQDSPWSAPAVVNGAARLFVAGTADGMVWEWDPLAGRRVRAVADGISCAVLADGHGGPLLATGSPEGVITLHG